MNEIGFITEIEHIGFAERRALLNANEDSTRLISMRCYAKSV